MQKNLLLGLFAALEVYVDDLVAPRMAITNRVMGMVIGRVTKRAKTTDQLDKGHCGYPPPTLTYAHL